jgi:hypothetical protein
MRVVVAFVGVIVVLGLSLAFDYPALDCLGLNRLIFRGLGLVWLARRIVWLAFLCCFVQVISLSSAAGGRHGKIKVFDARTPNNQFKRRCGRGQMGREFCGCARRS